MVELVEAENGPTLIPLFRRKPLTEVALERLTTIARNSELGSGMQVALKDLEIRGAGNLLGGEQSGHIAEVGLIYICGW